MLSYILISPTANETFQVNNISKLLNASAFIYVTLARKVSFCIIAYGYSLKLLISFINLHAMFEKAQNTISLFINIYFFKTTGLWLDYVGF